MISKASQRANGRQLAIHLLNAHDNERVEVAHIRGAIASDLSGAIEEWHAISRATRCKKYLYSLSINPDPGQGALNRRQYKDYIARVEKKLGLTDQPRAIVFHTKEGREHCHVVWSRIIPDQLKAVQISHDRKALQAITRRFAKEHGLTLPENMKEGGNPSEANPPARVTMHEKHQEERSGISKEERVSAITRIWRQTGTGRDFVHGLEQAGYQLAKGDSVPYVVVDRCGEIHSLPRQIEDARTKDIRARLADYPPESLPDASTLKQEIRNRLTAIAPQFNRNADTPWIRLKDSHDRRRGAFHARLAAMKVRHRTERSDLMETQKHNLGRFRRERLRRTTTGFMAFFAMLPGISTLIARHHRKHDRDYLQQCRQARRAVTARQRAEFEDLKRQARAIVRVEKREIRSLTTGLRRDFLRARIPGEFHAAARNPSPGAPAVTSPPCAPDVDEFLTNAGDVTTPVLPPRTKATPVRLARQPDKESLTAAFSPSAPPEMRAAFIRAAGLPRKTDEPRKPRLDLNS